jgi:hypothetical protein
MEKPATDRIIKGLIAPLAVWAVTALILERPKVKAALQEVDSHAFLKQRKALRRIERAKKNAMANGAWLAAGAAAFAVGLGLIAKAALTRR